MLDSQASSRCNRAKECWRGGPALGRRKSATSPCLKPLRLVSMPCSLCTLPRAAAAARTEKHACASTKPALASAGSGASQLYRQ